MSPRIKMNLVRAASKRYLGMLFLSALAVGVLTSADSVVKAQQAARARKKIERPSKEVLESFDKATLISLCLHLYSTIDELENEVATGGQATPALSGRQTPQEPSGRPAPKRTPSQKKPAAQKPKADKSTPVAKKEPLKFSSLKEILKEIPEDQLPPKKNKVWGEREGEIATAWSNRNLMGNLLEAELNFSSVDHLDEQNVVVLFTLSPFEFEHFYVRDAKLRAVFPSDEYQYLRKMTVYDHPEVQGKIAKIVLGSSPGVRSRKGKIPTFMFVELTDCTFPR